MKTKIIKTLAMLALLSTINPQLSTFAQGTAFTYQGRLNDGGNLASGAYDLSFALFDSLTAGNQVGSTLTSSPVNVNNGLFTVTLDFGAAVWDGNARWLEVGVRPDGSIVRYAVQHPRPAVTATPYAITAGNFTGTVNGGQLAGTLPDARLSPNVALRGGGNAFTGDQTIAGNATVNGVVSVSSDVTEAFKVSGAQAGYELQDRVLTGIPGRWVVFAANGAMGFWNAGANRMTLTSAGHLTVPVLTISGGADMAEPFKMSGRDLPKGAVVVIDEANPGHLRLSESAYDTRVAGIISGANGVKPGISLSQQGVMEGDQNVALSGRVYVQADASAGPIEAGDLLTTSLIPGHAMKARDHTRSQGAILGKAMTNLNEGQGMVLVLVTLQ